MLRKLHDFFMEPIHEGQPTRAQQLDDILNTVKTGRLTFRAALYLAGALVALSAGWEHLKTWLAVK